MGKKCIFADILTIIANAKKDNVKHLKMEIKKVIKQEGEYQCNIDVTVEEWKEILQDKTITTDNHKDVLLKFYSEPKHKSTCKELGSKYNVSPQSFNGTITNFAKVVQKNLNRFEIIGTDGKPTYWIIPMQGKHVGEYFEWTMRPELVQAMDELNLKNKHLLQKIYDNAIEDKHWVFSYWFPLYKKSVQEYKEQAINNNWTDTVFQKLVKDTTDNGISDLQQGNFTWKEFEKIKSNWSEIQLIIKNIAEKSQISKTQYQEILNFFRKQTTVNRLAGTNRVIAAFLPNIVTTVVNYQYLKNVITELKNRLVDYPTIQGDWLIDNINFIEYCNSNIEFKDSWHSSVFAWYLKEYFEQEKRLILEKKASMQEYIDLLLNNKNLIFTGAPGTGKTYLSKEIAKKIIGVGTDEELNNCGQFAFVQFHPSYDYTDFVEGLRPGKRNGEELGFELKDGIFKSFCKKALKNLIDSKKSQEELKKEDVVLKNIFDFLDKCINDGNELELSTGNKFTIYEYNESKIKIKVPNNTITSDLTLPLNELFQLLINQQKLDKVKDVRDFFNRSHNRQSDSYIFTLYNDRTLEKEIQIDSEFTQVNRKNYVFIIDEINRAEISKVFGELFFSIDAGYRGEKGKVKTQYSNLQDEDDIFYEGFYVPENVYIIGTMNDIDRSVESMDFAMRRRFAWKEVSALDRISIWEGKIDIWKNEAEKRMTALNNAIEEVQGLSSAYHIGPAYFLNIEKYQDDENPFEQLWKRHLKGVIFEYLRGIPNSAELLEKLKSAYDLKQDV